MHVAVATLVSGVRRVSGGDAAARHPAPSSVLSGSRQELDVASWGIYTTEWISPRTPAVGSSPAHVCTPGRGGGISVTTEDTPVPRAVSPGTSETSTGAFVRRGHLASAPCNGEVWRESPADACSRAGSPGASPPPPSATRGAVPDLPRRDLRLRQRGLRWPVKRPTASSACGGDTGSARGNPAACG